jgi:enoyl-CoA hydratase/carnithine racemase/carbon monoxide dehydrogenase subunit G
MEMKDEIRVEAARAIVWEALNNPEVLKTCIPGCESLEQVSTSEYVSLVVVKVGPIKAKFNGKVTLTDIVAPASYKLIGEGQGGVAGFAKSEITVELVEITPEATLIKYGVTANIGGKIAQLGSRLIDSTARKMAEQFFSRFNEQVCPAEIVAETAAESLGAEVCAGELREWLGELSCGDQILVTMVDVVENEAQEQAHTIRSTADQLKKRDFLGKAFSLIKRSSTNIYQSIASNLETKTTTQPHARETPSQQTTGTPKHQAAVVTINRAAQRNAVSLAMWQELGRIFTVLGQQPQVRAIILTGAGEHFSAGADIAEFSKVRATVEQGVEYEQSVDACCDAIAATPKPTIAVINGFCMGGACHLAMSCDFRFANSNAQFAIPAARLSIVYGVRGVQRLLALVGVSKAKHILYSAQRFSAQQGMEMGFIDQVATDPIRAAKSYAGVMADNAPLTISGSKVLLNGLTMDLGTLTTELVDHVVNVAVGSADYRDARQAFVEKRRPVFVGK